MESGLPASQAACTVGLEQTLYTWRMTFSSHSLQHDTNGGVTITVTNAASCCIQSCVPEGCTIKFFIRHGCIQQLAMKVYRCKRNKMLMVNNMHDACYICLAHQVHDRLGLELNSD